MRVCVSGAGASFGQGLGVLPLLERFNSRYPLGTNDFRVFAQCFCINYNLFWFYNYLFWFMFCTMFEHFRTFSFFATNNIIQITIGISYNIRFCCNTTIYRFDLSCFKSSRPLHIHGWHKHFDHICSSTRFMGFLTALFANWMTYGVYCRCIIHIVNSDVHTRSVFLKKKRTSTITVTITTVPM